jgi:aspartate aminotransferase
VLSQAGIHAHEPEGGFYLFLDFSSLREQLAARGIADGPTLCSRLLDETGVAILPGAAFARPTEELTARLAYVDFDGAAAMAASEGISFHEQLPPSFLERWCGRVLGGVDRLAKWVVGGRDEEHTSRTTRHHARRLSNVA